MRKIQYLIFCSIIGLVLQGCHTAPTVPTVQLGIPLQDICARYNVAWTWDGVTQVVILEYKSNKAKALVGSNVILIGKNKVILSSPLRRANSTIYVPEDFEAKVLSPFGISTGSSAIQANWAQLRARKIIIDPGHGGKDPGASSPAGVLEKEIVLDISRRIKVLLEDVGLKVVMTRDSDKFVSLNERTEIASRSDGDLFVSIHANSNPARKTQGMETYFVKTNDKDDLDEEQRRKNEKIFAKSLQMKHSPVLTQIVADMMYSFKITESAKLARHIVDHGSKHAQTPNRGARSCRFFVVRNTLVPAVLVEVGFLTNRQEEKKLNSSAYRQKIAESIVHSIVAYATDS